MFSKKRTFGDFIAETFFKIVGDYLSGSAEIKIRNLRKKVMYALVGLILSTVGVLLLLIGAIVYISTIITLHYSLLLVGAIITIIGVIMLPKRIQK